MLLYTVTGVKAKVKFLLTLFRSAVFDVNFNLVHVSGYCIFLKHLKLIVFRLIDKHHIIIH